MSDEALLWGGLSGIAGSMAILTLYAALAIGPMSILSPLTAVISAIVPLSWGLILGERLSLLGYIALGIALVAVVLVGFVPEKGAVRPRLRGVVYATVSGVLIGVFLILVDRAPDDSGPAPAGLQPHHVPGRAVGRSCWCCSSSRADAALAARTVDPAGDLADRRRGHRRFGGQHAAADRVPHRRPQRGRRC